MATAGGTGDGLVSVAGPRSTRPVPQEVRERARLRLGRIPAAALDVPRRGRFPTIVPAMLRPLPAQKAAARRTARDGPLADRPIAMCPQREIGEFNGFTVLSQ